MSAQPNLRGVRWADPDAERVAALIGRSQQRGWREALEELDPVAPFFAKRMRNLGLGNWHLLVPHDRRTAALDVGSGFGSLSLGLAGYYRQAIGAEFLPDRVAFAALRAREEEERGCRFVRSSGLALPFATGAFSLVSFNGVLEWAGLHGGGDPRRLQLRMLREARRVLRAEGHVAVAIENRFALESLLGLKDTHSGVVGATVLPRFLAGLLTRLRTGAPYRTYLYGRAGYRRLLAEAGFQSVRVLDLVSSYNDYDFIVDTSDGASYALLARSGAPRAFYRPAGVVRQWLGRRRPGMLGGLGYAHLVLGGYDTRTILDAGHPVWRAAREAGMEPGRFRFACQGREPGQLAVLTHDGDEVTGMLELATELPPDAAGSILPAPVHHRFAARLGPVGRLRWGGLSLRLQQPWIIRPRAHRLSGSPAAGWD